MVWVKRDLDGYWWGVLGLGFRGISQCTKTGKEHGVIMLNRNSMDRLRRSSAPI